MKLINDLFFKHLNKFGFQNNFFFILPLVLFKVMKWKMLSPTPWHCLNFKSNSKIAFSEYVSELHFRFTFLAEG